MRSLIANVSTIYIVHYLILVKKLTLHKLSGTRTFCATLEMSAEDNALLPPHISLVLREGKKMFQTNAEQIHANHIYLYKWLENFEKL